MTWLINLLGNRVRMWIILGAISAWICSTGYMYLQGRHDGKANCQAYYKAQEVDHLTRTLKLLEEVRQDQQKFWEHQDRQNKELAQTLEDKIHNKEVIVKEKLREVPIEVAADCSIDYNAVRVHNIIAAPTTDN